MVKIIQLEPDIAVAPQLVEADFADIAARASARSSTIAPTARRRISFRIRRPRQRRIAMGWSFAITRSETST